MNKASHKRKIKLARRMRKQSELSRKISLVGKGDQKIIQYGYRNIFDSEAWMKRKQAIKERVMKQIKITQERKRRRLLRKQNENAQKL